MEDSKPYTKALSQCSSLPKLFTHPTTDSSPTVPGFDPSQPPPGIQMRLPGPVPTLTGTHPAFQTVVAAKVIVPPTPLQGNSCFHPKSSYLSLLRAFRYGTV